MDLFSHYPKETLERFREFHRENIHVWEEFKRLSFEMKNAGRKKYSAETIVNVLRWKHDLKTEGEEFKINNNFRSIYARLMVYYHPEFEGFFELRLNS